MNNDSQRPAVDAYLDWSTANVLAVGIDTERSSSLHAQVLCLEVLHFANVQVSAEVNRGKHRCKPEGIDAANHADIELAVIQLCVRRDLHAAAVSGSVGESRQDRGLVAACRPGTAFFRREDLHGKRSESKDRRCQTQGITAMS